MYDYDRVFSGFPASLTDVTTCDTCPSFTFTNFYFRTIRFNFRKICSTDFGSSGDSNLFTSKPWKSQNWTRKYLFYHACLTSKKLVDVPKLPTKKFSFSLLIMLSLWLFLLCPDVSLCGVLTLPSF